MSFVDCNVCLGTWPLKLPHSCTADDLGVLCREEDTRIALASPLEAILAYDPEEPNLRVFAEAESRDWMIPVPVLNPRMRNWKRLLDSYLASSPPRAVKLYPVYHGYPLDAQAVDELAGILIEARIPLMVCMRVEDERYQHAAMAVRGLDMQSVLDLSSRHPGLDILCLNAYRNEAIRAAGHPRLHVDLAFAEIYPTVPDLLRHLGPEQLLFGSHTPFFVARAAAMKVVWARAPGAGEADLAPETIEAVAHGNAERLFGLTPQGQRP